MDSENQKTIDEHWQNIGSELLALELNFRLGVSSDRAKRHLAELYGKKDYLHRCKLMAIAAHNALVTGGGNAIPEEIPDDGLEF